MTSFPNFSFRLLFFHTFLSSKLLPSQRFPTTVLHWYCVRVNMLKRYRPLQVMDLSKVLTWWIEWDSKDGRHRTPSLSHHAPQWRSHWRLENIH